MNEYGLGYVQLNKDERQAYLLLEDAMKRYATSCDVSSVKRNVNLMKVMTTVLGDHPGIIYFNKTMIRTIAGSFGKQLNFIGCINRRQAEKYEEELKNTLEDAVWEIDKRAKNDMEILIGISEFLQKNVRYDAEELKHSSQGKSRSPMSHNAYGALVEHKAVCDGYAGAFSLIAQYFGMRVMLVEGRSSYNRSSSLDHAWNIIEYRGNYFHVDATWDANTYDSVKAYSYGYFGMTDDEIAVDHEWDFRSTPKCNSEELSYYKNNNLYAYSDTQIENIIYSGIKHKRKVIQLKMSPSVTFGDKPGKFIEKKILNAASRGGYTSQLSYSWKEPTRCLIITLE